VQTSSDEAQLPSPKRRAWLHFRRAILAGSIWESGREWSWRGLAAGQKSSRRQTGGRLVCSQHSDRYHAEVETNGPLLGAWCLVGGARLSIGQVRAAKGGPSDSQRGNLTNDWEWASSLFFLSGALGPALSCGWPICEPQEHRKTPASCRGTEELSGTEHSQATASRRVGQPLGQLLRRPAARQARVGKMGAPGEAEQWRLSSGARPEAVERRQSLAAG